MSRFGLFSSSFKHPSLDFLSHPLFFTWVSVSLHLVLFFGVFASWVFRQIRNGAIERHSKRSLATQSNQKWRQIRAARLCCLILALNNFCICCSNCFFWHTSGWSDEKSLVTLLDFFIRSSAFLALFIYLHTQLSRSSISLTVRWGLCLTISCCSIVLDFSHHQSSPVQLLVSDFVFVISGFVFWFAGLFGRVVEESNALEEPLLNGDGNGSASIDSSNKSKGSEAVTSYESSGFFSILTFSWVGPVVSTGYKKVLDLEDVPQLAGRDSVNECFRVFKSSLDSVCGGSIDKLTTVQLLKALIVTTWADIVVTAILALLYTFASYVGPSLIDTFVQYLNGRRQYANQGYVLVSAFFVAKLVECLARRHWFFRLQRAGIKARSVLVAMIYKKGLTLSSHSKQAHTSGEMMNIMAVDAERIGNFGWYMHDPWLVFIQVILALLVLYKNLGLASIAALVATVIVMLVNYPLSTILEKFQDKLMKAKDKRMKATSEILKNMRILKLQGWEMKFLSNISRLRESEAGWLKKFLYTNATTSFLFLGAPTFVSVITFVACMLVGIPLDAGKILSALATFRILQEPIYNLPETISIFIQTKVSLNRIASFLRLEDLKSNVVERLPRASSEVAVEITGGNFSWDSSCNDPTLKDINVRVNHGMKLAVCGTVGSGKSSLLSCVLGEMLRVSGTLRVSGLKAYVSQSAWIQSGKIVDNILFGKEMDRERYKIVLEACSLKKDLEILSFGDQTVIGERGINLSGGQKQRIQIARALYQDADIYLLDDPFSAVDAHTGTHLFKECLLGHLKSKTVIYVTHQVEFLPAADLILVMKDGRIAQAGKYDDILGSRSDFMELEGAHEKTLSALDSVEIMNSSNSTIAKENKGVKALQDPNANDSSTDQPDDTAEPKAQIVQEEEREKGKVGIPVYWKYITAAHGGALVPFILLAHISFQILQVGSNYWMAWATPISADVKPAVHISTLIIVFVAFSIGSALCILFRTTLLATAAYKTTTLLFDKMHLCIFRAPMSFFDATPSGRILNRASTDQSALDMSIPYQVGGVAFSIINLLAIVAIMSQVAWQVFVIFIPTACVCLYYQQYYLPAARELARLVGVCKAPMIQHFSETISGSTTIRGFNQQSRFEDKSRELIDGFSRPKFHIAAAMEWLCFRLDLLSSLTFACSLIFLISIPAGLIEPSIIGLSVTYGLNLNILQVRVIWNICELVNKIISVERILQYTNISSEPPLLVEANRPAPSWPLHGKVDIRDLQVRYAPHMPLVLRGITCTFHGGRKTGIMGRTGSGKSTLIQAIFRIVEPASGSIIIDGVNISMLGLHDLRSRLSIIPQDPTMFEGTTRSNLDPLEEYTDDQIWEALDKCQLGDEVRKKEGELNSLVAENGENWSMGQRQLVCLGRVLLKRTKILVLDEATASVDTATDNLIQQTLRQHFSDSTVLTIAHRITSVLDSDMVLVLSQGLIEECDSPTRLLEEKSSSFAKLVAEYTSRSKSSKQ